MTTSQNDIAVTIHALERVLDHLSEDAPENQRNLEDVEHWRDRAAARVTVKRRLAFAQQSAQILWQAAKDRG